MADKPSNEDIGALFLGDEPEAPEVVEEITEEVVEEVLEEELPAGDDHEVTPEIEGDDSELEATETPEDIVEVEWDGQLIEAPRGS